MADTFSTAPGQRLMLAFRGFQTPSPEFLHSMREIHPAGVTLFRPYNIDTPAQLKALTALLQSSAREMDLPLLLIALDQEGGQLMAVGGATPLPGNMALGAARSSELAFQAGQVLGSELAAMGVNVDYAPCVDVNTNPANPVVGVRSFGEEPVLVANLSAALLQGIQSQGVAATAKHFPGHGDTSSDSHLGMARVNHSMAELQSIDLPPFKIAIEAGVKMVMTGHLGVPALNGENDLPATLSKQVLQATLRKEMGFAGVIISDAMDMRAIRQGDLLVEDAARAVAAGCDLLLGTAASIDHQRLLQGISLALENQLLSEQEHSASLQRIQSLKHWLSAHTLHPPLEVVNSAEHRTVADRIAERSITLVKNEQGLIPLRVEDQQKIAVIVPQPRDLTPADTSSYLTPLLGQAVREIHSNTFELSVPLSPDANEIEGILLRLSDADVVIVGTINAASQPGQAELVKRIHHTGRPTLVAALRLPYDLVAFPEVSTYLCTYSILKPSMKALAKVLFGVNPPCGHLPVTIPGVAKAGFGL
jgi:beta-N-acetylhexosaminidase